MTSLKWNRNRENMEECIEKEGQRADSHGCKCVSYISSNFSYHNLH